MEDLSNIRRSNLYKLHYRPTSEIGVFDYIARRFLRPLVLPGPTVLLCR